MESALLKDINDTVLIYIDEDNFPIAVTDYHHIRVEWVAIHGPNRRQLYCFTHLPSYLHLHCVVYEHLPITSGLALLPFFLLLE